jgi:hypothetical protein
VEWEHSRQLDHLQGIRLVPYVPRGFSIDELRLHFRKLRHEGMCSRLRTTRLWLMSLLDQMWQLFLTQAILVGIGSSMLYYPVISLTPIFFNRL